MRLIVDCFTFFNELDLLEFRLKELEGVVDYYVLVESTETFTGSEKPLYYQQNKERFGKYSDKIIHVVCENMGEGSAWDRESHQRNAIMEGLQRLPLRDSDVIIINDCDEITNPDLLSQIRRYGFNIFSEQKNLQYMSGTDPKRYEEDEVFGIIQDFYYYNLYNKKNHTWWFSRILSYKKLKEIHPQHARRDYYVDVHYWYKQGGWHFSYFSSVEDIIYKLKSFSHTEFSTDKYCNKEMILSKIKESKDLFGRGEVEDCQYISPEDNNNLPKNYTMLL